MSAIDWWLTSSVVLLVFTLALLWWLGARVSAEQQQKIDAQWSMLDEIVTAWGDIDQDDCIQSDSEFRNLARRLEYLTTYVTAERDARRARGES